MSQESFLNFLLAARGNTVMLTRYNRRSLGQLLFHAKNDGYDFTAEDVADVVGKLEYSLVTTKDNEAMDGQSTLWRQMWGRFHLEYLVDHVVARHEEDELRALVGKRG